MCISDSNNYVRLFTRIGFLSVLLFSLVACKVDNTQGVYYLALNICDERYAHSEWYIVPILFRNGILCLCPDYHTKSQVQTPMGLANAFLLVVQLQQAGYEIGSGIRESTQAKLIAGHKKDVVYKHRYSSRVGIYGWHRLSGEPIQPYITVHHDEHYDYSHSVRPVNPEVFKNGEWVIWSDR